jgi:hypothetical protein
MRQQNEKLKLIDAPITPSGRMSNIIAYRATGFCGRLEAAALRPVCVGEEI